MKTVECSCIHWAVLQKCVCFRCQEEACGIVCEGGRCAFFSGSNTNKLLRVDKCQEGNTVVYFQNIPRPGDQRSGLEFPPPWQGRVAVVKPSFCCRRVSVQGVRFRNWNVMLSRAWQQLLPVSYFIFYRTLLISTNNLRDPLQITQSCKLVSVWTNTLKPSDAAWKKCSLLQEEKEACALRGNTFLQPDKCFPATNLPIRELQHILWSVAANGLLARAKTSFFKMQA